MRQAVLEEPQRFVVADRPAAAAGPDEAVVRVRSCGVCGSDLKMWSGTHAFLRPPLVLGHELDGELDGAPVVLFPPIGCGSCHHCRTGQPQLCPSMEFVGGQRAGGLGEFVVAPRDNLLAVDAAVPVAQRVLIEPLAVAVHAVARAAPAAGAAAVVVGAGAIGLFTALVLRERGLAPVLVADVADVRRARAGALGFETFDPAESPLGEVVADRIRPEGADAVFECVGSASTIAAALAATVRGGSTVLVGNAPPVFEVDGLALQRGDRSLVGVLMYDRADFTTAMTLLANGLLAGLADDEVTEEYPLEAVGEAFRAAKEGRVRALRAVVRP
jgi:L-iditol 2-dehydrogenase